METYENYVMQHQDLRIEDGVAYGDVIGGVDFDYAKVGWCERRNPRVPGLGTRSITAEASGRVEHAPSHMPANNAKTNRRNRVAKRSSRRFALTVAKKKRLFEAIGLGMSYARAALYAGIAEKTFYNHRNRAEYVEQHVGDAVDAAVKAGVEPDKAHRQAIANLDEYDRDLLQYIQDLKKALADFEYNALSILESAAKQDPRSWTAIAWKLERRFNHWRRPADRVSMEQSGTMTFAQLTKAAADRREREGLARRDETE